MTEAYTGSARRVRQPALLVSGLLAAVFVSLFIYASIMPAPSKVPAPLDAIRFMAAEERDIRDSLSDPDSVKFRNDSVSTFRRVPVVCGEVNFKNGTNGYVGFRRFVSGTTIRQFEDSIGPDEMSRLWLIMCDRAK
jgi:hypothetical protein